jgi:uncharacterized membrane protein YdjX (TVP38/TMEM64 family)
MTRTTGFALLAIVVSAMVAGVAVRLGVGVSPAQIEGWLDATANQGSLGWGILAGLQALIALSGVLPASLMGVAAGTIYGPFTGFLLAATGTLLGALVAFLLGRSLLRPLVTGWLADRVYVRKMDEEIARRGWLFVCLLRISPVLPFAATSYALALTRISLSGYLVGTLAALPPLFGYVVVGSLARPGLQAWSDGGVVHWALIGLAAIGTLGLIWQISRLARSVRGE